MVRSSTPKAGHCSSTVERVETCAHRGALAPQGLAALPVLARLVSDEKPSASELHLGLIPLKRFQVNDLGNPSFCPTPSLPVALLQGCPGEPECMPDSFEPRELRTIATRNRAEKVLIC
jgi:hypothetical protein